MACGSKTSRRAARSVFIVGAHSLVEAAGHAAVGFKVTTDAGVHKYPRQACILLDPDASRFETTILHETSLCTCSREGASFPLRTGARFHIRPRHYPME